MFCELLSQASAIFFIRRMPYSLLSPFPLSSPLFPYHLLSCAGNFIVKFRAKKLPKLMTCHKPRKGLFSISELIPDLPTSSCWVFLPVKRSCVRWGSCFRIRLIKWLLPFIRSCAGGVIQNWWNPKICESQWACEILAGSTHRQVAGNANKEWSLLWSAVEVLSFWDYGRFSLWELT